MKDEEFINRPSLIINRYKTIGFNFLILAIDSFHCKLYSFALQVDIKNLHPYVLMNADYFIGVGDVTVGQLG